MEKRIPSSLSALGRFRGFKPESELSVREAKVETNPVLEKMKIVWRVCDDFDPDNWDNGYDKMIKRIKKIRHSAKDIELFSLALAGYQDEKDFSDKAGFYLSALINTSKGREFVIHTAHLTEIVNFIGYRNKRTITVHGDTGWCVGDEMKSGTVIVDGDAGHNMGYGMRGGTITVKGNAGDAVGNYMRRGTIIVAGDTGGDIGEQMKGGEIYLNRGHGSISEKKIIHGKIFHKEELIFEK
jgi:hypothetical protein